MAGQSFWSWRRKSWRREESKDFGCVIVGIYYNIHTYGNQNIQQNVMACPGPFPAVTEALRFETNLTCSMGKVVRLLLRIFSPMQLRALLLAAFCGAFAVVSPLAAGPAPTSLRLSVSNGVKTVTWPRALIPALQTNRLMVA